MHYLRDEYSHVFPGIRVKGYLSRFKLANCSLEWSEITQLEEVWSGISLFRDFQFLFYEFSLQ